MDYTFYLRCYADEALEIARSGNYLDRAYNFGIFDLHGTEHFVHGVRVFNKPVAPSLEPDTDTLIEIKCFNRAFGQVEEFEWVPEDPSADYREFVIPAATLKGLTDSRRVIPEPGVKIPAARRRKVKD